MIKKMLSIAAAVSLLGGLMIGVISYDTTLAKEKSTIVKIEKVEAKIDIYLIDQELADIRNQLFEIRKRWAPEYEKEYGEPYETIEHLLDFIKINDASDEKDYRDLVARQEELLEAKREAQRKLRNQA